MSSSHLPLSTGVLIGDRAIGAGHACFVIAEAGVNHNGDPRLAHELIDLAADAGADAVKFQTFEPGLVASAAAEAAPYQVAATGSSAQQEMLAGLVLPRSVWPDLADHAGARGIVFLSTPFDVPSADLLEGVDMAAYKVPSGELDNLAFVANLAGRGRPLIISTGMGTMDEVAAALAAAEPAPGRAVLHCVTAYPAPVSSANLRAIPTMAAAFGVPVGWSDHTIGSVTAVAAVALGAALLEKHVTTDPTLPGPDHAASADRASFAAYVSSVRQAESALGDGAKRPAPEEAENRMHARRSLHAARPLAAGHVLEPADVVALRPSVGLSPSTPLGKLRLTKAMVAGQPIMADDVD